MYPGTHCTLVYINIWGSEWNINTMKNGHSEFNVEGLKPGKTLEDKFY